MDVLELFIYINKLREQPFITTMQLPEVLYKDFNCFIAGHTLTKMTDSGEPLIPQSLYNEWLDKLNTKGFDYVIDCSLSQ